MLEDTKGNILDRYLNDLAKAYYKTAAKVMEEKRGILIVNKTKEKQTF